MATHSSILAWSVPWTVQSMGLQRVKHDRVSLVPQMVKRLLQCGRPGFNPWVGKSPGGGHSNPLHYSGLENPMHCIVHESQRAGRDSTTLSFSLRNKRHLFLWL